MVKTEAEVRAKMQERVATAGKYLKSGMDAAVDPIDVLLSNPDGYQAKLVAGVQEAARKGSYKAGLLKAKERNAWQNSKDRAAAHFEERAVDMVDNAMASYPERMRVIEAAQKAVADMPTTTRAQRIAKSAKYQEVAGQGYDKLYGRKS